MNRPAGRTNSDGSYTIPAAIDSDEITNYEFGWKSSLADGKVTFTQDGNDLKNELRLAGSGYLSNQSKTPSVGNELDELLSKLG